MKQKKALLHYINISLETGLLVPDLLTRLESIPEEKGELRYIKAKLSEVYNIIKHHHTRCCVNKN